MDPELRLRLVYRLRDIILRRRLAGQQITLIIGLAHPDSSKDLECSVLVKKPHGRILNVNASYVVAVRECAIPLDLARCA
jgi:hypoxanthine-guanine phosphoribosyltransferase